MLLRAIAAGDGAAFTQLVERHVDRAFGFARRLLDDHVSAEVVTASLFVEVWKNPALRSGPDLPFRIWLCGAVLERCRLVRTETNPEGDDEPRRTDPADDDLARALRQLAWQDRAVLLLAYQERLTNTDIALALGMTEVDVATLIAAARRSFRARFGNRRTRIAV